MTHTSSFALIVCAITAFLNPIYPALEPAKTQRNVEYQAEKPYYSYVHPIGACILPKERFYG